MRSIEITIPAVGPDGYLPAEYGGNAPQDVLRDGLSPVSPEIRWTPVPGAVAYAVECIDYASAAVGGMIFVHWTALNVKEPFLAKDASRADQGLLQGVSSVSPGVWRNTDLSPEEKRALNVRHSFYVGPRPPEADHWYTFRVYALSALAEVKAPFFIGAFRDAIRGKVVGMGEIEVAYKRVKG